MGKFLFTAIVAAAICPAALAQEPVGGSSFGQAAGDTLPATYRRVAPAMQSLYEQPSFMQGGVSPTFGTEAPAVRRYSKLPEFGAGDALYNAMPEPYIKPLPHDPYAYDFSRSGAVMSWGSGMIIGGSHRTTLPGLLSRQGASLTAVQSAGNFTFTGSFTAYRYLLGRGTASSYGASGSVTYHFNDNISATVFGSYYTNQSYYSMAAMPYFGSKGYGGFLTFMGETLGVDVGAERHYDSYARRWVTSPIITPKIKFSEKFTLDLPVGWLVKDFLDDKVFKSNRNSGPMIMPEVGPMPGKIPFDPPEMPGGGW